MTHLEDATKVHAVVDREVLVKNENFPLREAKTSSLLRTLASTSAEIAALALGDTGTRLQAFAQVVQDSNHPDLSEIKESVLNDEHDFSIVAQEMVRLTQMASDAKLQNILPYISKIVPRISGYGPATKELDDPHKTLNYVRFVPDRNQREVIRSKKKVQTVNLQAIIQKNPEQWDKSGNSFLSLSRNQIPFQQDIDECFRRSKGMLSIGASGLASRMADRGLEFKMHSQERYYGFNKTSVTSASIIGAQMMGCELMSSVRSTRVALPFEKALRIFDALETKGNLSRTNPVLYEPRLYPIHEIAETMSERTRKLIETLESFPETSGCPIFDHYWCLVPSIFVLHIPTMFGGLAKDISDMTGNFDKALIRANAVPSVLLGEKDGKSYFVDYWC